MPALINPPLLRVGGIETSITGETKLRKDCWPIEYSRSPDGLYSACKYTGALERATCPVRLSCWSKSRSTGASRLLSYPPTANCVPLALPATSFDPAALELVLIHPSRSELYK